MDNNEDPNVLSEKEIQDLGQNLNYDISRYLEYREALQAEWSRSTLHPALLGDIVNSELVYLPYRTFTQNSQDNRYVGRENIRTHGDYISNNIPENNGRIRRYRNVCLERVKLLLCTIPIQYHTLLHEQFTTSISLCNSAREFLDALDWLVA